jgi:hypothetical protein
MKKSSLHLKKLVKYFETECLRKVHGLSMYIYGTFQCTLLVDDKAKGVRQGGVDRITVLF